MSEIYRARVPHPFLWSLVVSGRHIKPCTDELLVGVHHGGGITLERMSIPLKLMPPGPTTKLRTLTCAVLVVGAALILAAPAYRSVHVPPEHVNGHGAGDRYSYTLDFTAWLLLALLGLYVAVSLLSPRPVRVDQRPTRPGRVNTSVAAPRPIVWRSGGTAAVTLTPQAAGAAAASNGRRALTCRPADGRCLSQSGSRARPASRPSTASPVGGRDVTPTTHRGGRCD